MPSTSHTMVHPNPPHRDETHFIELPDGRSIADPYHALEDPDAEGTKTYAKGCQAEFNDYISTLGTLREDLKDELTNNINYPTTSLPSLRGHCWYLTHNRGLENQSVVYRVHQDNFTTTAETFNPDTTEEFFNPNHLSDDGTVSLSYCTKFTKDGSLWAYGTQSKGSDWITVRVKNTETKEDLEDIVRWVKFSSVQWIGTKGFFYSGYGIQNISEAGKETTKQEYHRSFYHKLGTDQSEDVEVFRSQRPDEKDWMYGIYLSDCEKYAFGSVSRGCESKNLLFFKPVAEVLDPSIAWRTLFDAWDAEYDVVYNRGSVVLIKTNLEAKNNKLIQLDLSSEIPKTTMKTVFPEQPYKLGLVVPSHNEVVLGLRVDAADQVFTYQWNSEVGVLEAVHRLEFEGMETFALENISARYDHEKVFISVANFNQPSTQFYLDMRTKANSLYRTTQLAPTAPDPSRFMTEQIKFTSKDGTIVPMFVVRKRGAVTTPQAALIYGYGGFGIDLVPSFSPSRLSLLDRGVMYVSVNLRGGCEYGKEWHDGGRRGNKQNVFDDFIAAAEDLIRRGYTTSDQLVMQGGSNGGLLVTAVANQRPDLYRGGIAQVPVTDMLRFHKFTIGHAWVPEYGNPDDAKDVDFMLNYSPLHTIPTKGIYPSMLIMTADHDDRVVPLHSFKFHAELRHRLHSIEGQNPFFLRVDLDAGHGFGKPKTKRIEETADVYSFILSTIQSCDASKNDAKALDG